MGMIMLIYVYIFIMLIYFEGQVLGIRRQPKIQS